jgi:hypothetical protein
VFIMVMKNPWKMSTLTHLSKSWVFEVNPQDQAELGVDNTQVILLCCDSEYRK